MSDLAYLITALAVPFLMGVIVGIGIVNRREPPNSQVVGEHILSACIDVTTNRKFVGEGLDVFSAITATRVDGKKFQIIVREAA